MNIKIEPFPNPMMLSKLEPRTVFATACGQHYMKMKASDLYTLICEGSHTPRHEVDMNTFMAVDLKDGSITTWNRDFEVRKIYGHLQIGART